MKFWCLNLPKSQSYFWQISALASQKSVNNLVGFLGDLKTPNFYSEITWPLKPTTFNNCTFSGSELVLQLLQSGAVFSDCKFEKWGISTLFRHNYVIRNMNHFLPDQKKMKYNLANFYKLKNCRMYAYLTKFWSSMYKYFLFSSSKPV